MSNGIVYMILLNSGLAIVGRRLEPNTDGVLDISAPWFIPNPHSGDWVCLESPLMMINTQDARGQRGQSLVPFMGVGAPKTGKAVYIKTSEILATSEAETELAHHYLKLVTGIDIPVVDTSNLKRFPH